MNALVRTACESRELDLRGLRTHVRCWRTHGADDASPVLVMLHGWMDVSASFQFVVDALQGRWRVFAPDLRGFGLTGRPTDGPGTASYWFPDYFADLDALLDALVPESRVHLVGHSMGGNIACVYAGVRPSRVETLVALEGFGMPATRPSMAPRRFAQWLDALKAPPEMRRYASIDAVVERLQKNNPRLSSARARFLADHWAARTAAGDWEILGDPAHKLPNPVLYREDEVLACWREVTAPVLWVEASDTTMFALWSRGDAAREAQLREEFAARVQAFRDVRRCTIDAAGHMVHHDQPERIAQAIERFIDAARARGREAA